MNDELEQMLDELRDAVAAAAGLGMLAKAKAAESITHQAVEIVGELVQVVGVMRDALENVQDELDRVRGHD